MKVKKNQKQQIATGEEICLTSNCHLKGHEASEIKQIKAKGSRIRRFLIRQHDAKYKNRFLNSGYNIRNLELLHRFKKILNKTKITTQECRNTVSKDAEKKDDLNCERMEKLDLIRSRLSENFYHSPEVYIRIAKGLIREMNLIKTG